MNLYFTGEEFIKDLNLISVQSISVLKTSSSCLDRVQFQMRRLARNIYVLHNTEVSFRGWSRNLPNDITSVRVEQAVPL